MNYPALIKALKFACLPTLSILLLLFFGFFSISKTIDFISSTNGWAVTIRIVAFISEIILVCGMYEKYLDEDKRKKALNIENAVNKRKIDYHTDVRHIFNGSTRSQYFLLDTVHDHIKIIEFST